MGQVIMARRGSTSELSIKVVGSVIQPIGVYGTLWVDTNTSIGKWIAAVVQPSNPSEGDIWIRLDSVSTNIVNIVKSKNVVNINIKQVLQYIGTSWEPKDAYYYDTTWTKVSATMFNPINDISFYGLKDCFFDALTGDWMIRLKSSEMLTFLRQPETPIDVFLVGGGGGGGMYGGGGGGYTNTKNNITVTKDTIYPIVVGGHGIGSINANGTGGGSSTAFGYTAAGGAYGASSGGAGGAGGSGGGGGISTAGATGGAGGSAGGNGSPSSQGNQGGIGQSTNTYEFNNVNSPLYSGGGGGYGAAAVGKGGSGGGGNGLVAGVNNTGGGGGARANGGSGIIVIRNHRA